MKEFFLFVTKILAITISFCYLLDFFYTYTYLHSNARNKINYVYNAEPKDYDVVIMGTSRANNHFVPELFEKDGLKTFNFGMSGGHLFETALLLKLMVDRKCNIKNLILEADLSLSNEHRDEGSTAKFMPYLCHSTIIKKHFSNQSDFKELYYIPFFRYIKYDSRIGFREMYKAFRNEPTNALDHQGYHPLRNIKKGNMKNNITNLKPLSNKYYQEIKKICEYNKIHLIVIMTPMCENTKGLEYFQKVKKMFPEIYNYENAVTDDKYFSSCGHLNDEGARLFTATIVKDFF